MGSLWALLMAGGSGTRFWPRSRKHKPKQLLAIGTDRPLLRLTSERITPLIPFERQLVVTAEAHVEAVRALLPEVPPEQVLGEPQPRDTAAAIGLGAHVIARLDEEATVVAMPSDHVLRPVEVFLEHLAVAHATLEGRPSSILVFGIEADRPATGYGWVRRGEKVGAFRGRDVFRLAAFVEKPDLEKAKAFLAAGDMSWNAGLFAFRPEALIAAIERHLPGMNEPLTRIARAFERDEWEQILAREFPALPKVSIDFGVMEEHDDVLLLPLPLQWDDVGSWAALARLLPADAAGNVVQGQAAVLKARDNIVVAEEGVVAAYGVEGLIVVHTPDATLVCRKDDAEAVKLLVEELGRRGMKDVL